MWKKAKMSTISLQRILSQHENPKILNRNKIHKLCLNTATVCSNTDLANELAGLLVWCRKALSNCNCWSFMILIFRDLGNKEYKLRPVN